MEAMPHKHIDKNIDNPITNGVIYNAIKINISKSPVPSPSIFLVIKITPPNIIKGISILKMHSPIGFPFKISNMEKIIPPMIPAKDTLKNTY